MHQRILIKECIEILDEMRQGGKMSPTEKANLAFVSDELNKLDQEIGKKKLSKSDIFFAISYIARLLVAIFTDKK